MCQDILEEIGRHLFTGQTSLGFWRGGGVARVCKAFNVAFDKMLWAHLPSILPLIWLLPWIKARNHQGCFYTLGRVPTPDEWSRFVHRASMVRKLDLSPFYLISFFVWNLLSHRTAGKPLLPGLRDLNWDVDQTDLMAHESALVASPCLGTLRLAFRREVIIPSGDDPTLAILQEVVRRSPAITRLTFEYLPRRPSSRNLRPISMLHRLSELRFPRGNNEVEYDLLRMLSAMDAISRLVIGVDLREDPFPDFCGFPALRHLHVINDPPAESIFKLFAMISSKGLLDVALNHNGFTDPQHSVPWSPRDLSAMCDSLAQRFSMLERLEINMPTRDVQSLDFVISPLASLRSLKEMHIQLKETSSEDTTISLSDALFAPFAGEWPQLTSFRLVLEKSSGCVSPRVLVLLADSCPLLEELCIPRLDVTLATVGDVASFSTNWHPLRVLCVREAIVDDHEMCARIVDGLFPEIDAVASSAPDPGTQGRRTRVGEDWWRLVRCALRTRQDSRKGVVRQDIHHFDDEIYYDDSHFDVSVPPPLMRYHC
ncbi:hypothetical protein OH76DRAFT_652433 [Lentinus brumalis]|uniref:F-box domain-containing protein n=1 Tax=Lentinus brumalis TaxID=2498619 RepID=A0A371D887_9APHY|nr:hypothetical protein OH76DRAFT_652433 [Polyporus brumalis]